MIFGLPTQLFSALGSFLMSYMAARVKAKSEMEAAERKYTLELLAAQTDNQTKIIQAQNELLKNDPTFAFTRRILALGVVFSVIGGIFYIAAFSGTPWIFTYQEIPFQLFGINFGTVVEKFVQVNGFPIIFGEALLHLVAIIISFYFGNSAGSMKNPYRK